MTESVIYSLMITITAEIRMQITIAICIAIQKPGIGWRSIESIMIPPLRERFRRGIHPRQTGG
jgi:hypothetical protein